MKLPHLVELTISSVLDELKRDVGPIANPGKSQSGNIHRDACLRTLSFKVGNYKLITAIRRAEVRKRAGVLSGGNLNSDCGKESKREKWCQHV